VYAKLMSANSKDRFNIYADVVDGEVAVI